MSHKLRRHCQSVLSQLSLPRPFSIPALCRRLEDQRGRVLHLHPLPPEAATSGACGLVITTSIADHIFYERRTSTLHQEHIVLHEIAHLLFGHHTIDLSQEAVRQVLLPDLSPHLVQRLLARTNYAARQEQEAEMLASLIRTKASKPSVSQSSIGLERLKAALGVHDPHT